MLAAAEGPFFAVVVPGVFGSLALAAFFHRRAPAVAVAFVGGVVGGFAAFAGWVRAPESLEHVDLLDHGAGGSFGGALPAAAQGYTIGLVTMGVVALMLARDPTGSSRFLRWSSLWLLVGGIAAASWVGAMLSEACDLRHARRFCSYHGITVGLLILDAIVLALLALLLPFVTERRRHRARGTIDRAPADLIVGHGRMLAGALRIQRRGPRP